MHRLMIAGALCALIAPSAMALGPSFGFGVHADFTSSKFPGPSVSGVNQQIGSAYGAGLGGGVHIDANLMVVSFRLSADYLHYGIDEDKFRDSFGAAVAALGIPKDQVAVSGGGLGITALSINGKMPVLPLPIISPYLTGGIGLAWLSRDEMKTSINGTPYSNTFPASTQGGKTQVDIGLGVDLKLGIALFLEVKYAWIFTDVSTSTYVPVTVGVTF
ncbi:MAG TPA: outer membrane beta-barrel protein [Bacteroidota bacterium]|nr:outer membrane beta-barrel protein [Bacteroidota bacterium]